MAELYQLPVAIYEYGMQPETMFNMELFIAEEQDRILRLSYHRKNHYNAVV